MKRYFYTDYDQISERYMPPMDNYIVKLAEGYSEELKNASQDPEQVW